MRRPPGRGNAMGSRGRQGAAATASPSALWGEGLGSLVDREGRDEIQDRAFLPGRE